MYISQVTSKNTLFSIAFSLNKLEHFDIFLASVLIGKLQYTTFHTKRTPFTCLDYVGLKKVQNDTIRMGA